MAAGVVWDELRPSMTAAQMTTVLVRRGARPERAAELAPALVRLARRNG